VVLVAPFPAIHQQRVTVVDGTVTATSKIFFSLSPIADSDPASPDLIDIFKLRAIAAAGSFIAEVTTLTPWAGQLSVDYMVMA